MASHDEILNFKTPYARKYGVFPIGKDKKQLFFNDGKSGNSPATLPSSTLTLILGYTPTRPKGMNPFSKLESERNNKIDLEQKKFLWGFTAQELVELGSYPDPNASLSFLDNPIK